ncbi:hypothetical protein EVAR_83484_1 [Eumeta japonica]|uniref:Uncharacterized protein n=1 Tax=Eumeta variegata TaxID=151549 RepID=A0A4C1ZK32_EUMVA|nr:hypothetical protein EVAR_83484_1 [Eumeta japonica]
MPRCWNKSYPRSAGGVNLRSARSAGTVPSSMHSAVAPSCHRTAYHPPRSPLMFAISSIWNIAILTALRWRHRHPCRTRWGTSYHGNDRLPRSNICVLGATQHLTPFALRDIISRRICVICGTAPSQIVIRALRWGVNLIASAVEVIFRRVLCALFGTMPSRQHLRRPRRLTTRSAGHKYQRSLRDAGKIHTLWTRHLIRALCGVAIRHAPLADKSSRALRLAIILPAHSAVTA